MWLLKIFGFCFCFCFTLELSWGVTKGIGLALVVEEKREEKKKEKKREMGWVRCGVRC